MLRRHHGGNDGGIDNAQPGQALEAQAAVNHSAFTERFIRKQPALANAMFLLKGIHCDLNDGEIAEVKALLASRPTGVALTEIACELGRPLEFVNEVLAMIMDGHARLAWPDKPASLDSPVLLGSIT